MIERRVTARRRVCFGGLLRVATFLPEIACTLRDVSLDGACIRLAPGTTLPARFDLHVPCRGENRRARVVWRLGDVAGLGFEVLTLDRRPDDLVPADLLKRLGESEEEVSLLRAALLSARTAPPDRLH